MRRVRGVSMIPTLQNKSLVLASSLVTVRQGWIVIARHEDKEVIKRVHMADGSMVELRGDNTDKHHSLSVKKTDIIAVVLCR